MSKAGIYLYRRQMVDGAMQGPGAVLVSEEAAAQVCGAGKGRAATAEEIAAASAETKVTPAPAPQAFGDHQVEE